jgi:hypothetical protein
MHKRLRAAGSGEKRSGQAGRKWEAEPEGTRYARLGRGLPTYPDSPGTQQGGNGPP